MHSNQRANCHAVQSWRGSRCKRCGWHGLIGAFDREHGPQINTDAWKLQDTFKRHCGKCKGLPEIWWILMVSQQDFNSENPFSWTFPKTLCVFCWGFQSEFFKAAMQMGCRLLTPLEIPPIQTKLDQHTISGQIPSSNNQSALVHLFVKSIPDIDDAWWNSTLWLAQSHQIPSNSPLAFQRQLIRSCQVHNKNDRFFLQPTRIT